MRMKTVAQAVLASTLAVGMPAALAQGGGAYGQDPAAGQGQQQGTQSYQSPGTASPGMPSQGAAPVTEQQVEKFAEAKDKVLEIQREYTDKINNADDQSEAQQLQAEAQQEMIDAVDDAGIDAQTYNQLATRMQTDDSFRQRVNQMQ